MAKTRSYIHVTNFILIFSLSIMLGFNSPLWGASGEQESVAKIIEGAKKEGEMVWYTQMSISESTIVLKEFEKKYPFIKTSLLRLGLDALMTKVMQENSAGVHKFDAISLSGFGFHVLKNKGVLQKYMSPQSLSFPEGARDPDGYGTSIYINPKVFVYNTNLVSPEDVPKSYEDLLDPKWKGGKICLDTTNYEWFANVLRINGREKGIGFMKKLAMQEPQIRRGNTLRTTLVAAGEFHFAVPVNGDYVERIKAKGAPIDWTGPEPVVVLSRPGGIAAKAPHPNAAKLFMDFVLSKEGQTVIRDLKRIPARSDIEPIPPRLTKSVKLYFSDHSLADSYEDITREYTDILVRKKW